MVNASFVFGMDHDDASVFERTVEWAIEQGIETATFHILTPYPGTALCTPHAGGRGGSRPTMGPVRHAPCGLPSGQMLARGAGGRLLARLPGLLPLGLHLPGRCDQAQLAGQLRHVAYAGGWKKLEPLWDWVIRARRVNQLLPVLESVLAEWGHKPAGGLREGTRPEPAGFREDPALPAA